MQTNFAWLTKLKAVELHKLAVLIGTPCSGTKAVQIQGIQNVLASLRQARNDVSSSKLYQKGEIRVVSVDMGIRNLAYSFWTAKVSQATSTGLVQYGQPRLHTWRKINVSSQSQGQARSDGAQPSSHVEVLDEEVAGLTTTKESFEPIDYATRAYSFVKNILREHNPSHVLIERQRFRSGGGAAVLEWTIRVGVFEGMLYAVLKTLADETNRRSSIVVEPVLPARVNRYWLEGRASHEDTLGKAPATKKTAREAKQAKIELVRQFLESARDLSPEKLFTLDDDTVDTVSAFLGQKAKVICNGLVRHKRVGLRRDKTAELSKLDDLSDSLLQGLAWIHWQNYRLQLECLGQEAYPLPI